MASSSLFSCIALIVQLDHTKETKLERDDFTFQLLIFVTEEKEGQNFSFSPVFVSC